MAKLRPMMILPPVIFAALAGMSLRRVCSTKGELERLEARKRKDG